MRSQLRVQVPSRPHLEDYEPCHCGMESYTNLIPIPVAPLCAHGCDYTEIGTECAPTARKAPSPPMQWDKNQHVVPAGQADAYDLQPHYRSPASPEVCFALPYQHTRTSPPGTGRTVWLFTLRCGSNAATRVCRPAFACLYLLVRQPGSSKESHACVDQFTQTPSSFIPTAIRHGSTAP